MKNTNPHPTYVLLLSHEKAQKLMQFYADDAAVLPTPYHHFYAKTETFNVSMYAPKKNSYKVVFQGPGAATDLPLWQEEPSYTDHAGSDEVGTGDFFGPIVVTACYVTKDHAQALFSLGVKDSKELDDAQMRTLVPLISPHVQAATVVVHPEKYASLIAQGKNMNTIKALMHHHAIVTLRTKAPYTAMTVIDQFANDASMRRYFSPLSPIQNLHWEEKAESRYLAVAASSILARVRFLDALIELAKPYSTQFPLGASQKVEEFGLRFAKQHGLETLKKVAKINFSTFRRIEETLS